MGDKQDLTKKVYILYVHETGEIVKHTSEESARRTMKREDETDCVIICISSNGAEKASVAAHKKASTGSVLTTIVHKGNGLSNGIADSVREDARKTYGDEVRDDANKARKLASEKKACA